MRIHESGGLSSLERYGDGLAVAYRYRDLNFRDGRVANIT